MRTLSLVLTVLLPHAASAQDTLWTPQHVAKLRFVTEAVISPDGKLVAYVLGVPRDLTKEKDGGAWTELHVVDTKGNSTPFVTGSVNVGSITWTPDGKQIAFLTKREKDATRSLYVISPKGGEARKLLSHAADIQGYSFSGDGKQIAFLATEPTSSAKKKLNEQGFTQEIYEEDQPFVRVWITDSTSRGRQPPVPGDAKAGSTPGADAPGSARMLNLKGSASELHFNPKENKLAVALAPSPGIDDHIMFRKVHIVELTSPASPRRKPGVDAKTPPANAGGSVVVKTTNLNNPGKLGQLAWSPDGKKLAMITGADKHDPKEGRLWIHGIKGGDWQNMTTKLKGHVESIAWNGPENIQYQFSEGVWTRFDGGYAMRPDEAPPKIYEFGPPDATIISSTTCSSSAWHFSFIGQTPTHPPEVFIKTKDDKLPRRLTDSNPWLKNMKFAKQEVIKYKAKDGLELEGILIHPLSRKAGERVPLVLTVHGGPEAHYSNGWLTMYHSLGQVAAARGMAVFYPNYRGSTGYGVKFSMMGQKEAAGKEFDDLIDGVDHLVKMGLVDEKKVGITGGSYGGYATAWGATYYSHRFAAGVMFVGLSNWLSCAGTTDIPQEMFLVHHRKWLWEDWEYFKKASPISYLEKHKTPLLIMHGKNDPRVNPGQSLELYRHLKVRNQAPVRLVLYPGEGHGNRRAASRLDYNIRLLQWMEHYLKGPGGKMPARDIDYGFPRPAPKTTNMSWDTRRRISGPGASATEVRGLTPWLGRGCPCCIGW
ncbi:MAG: S9 family peptidase [Planctomycetes bacterium]|nr:S9 family peptidase [Planctomycetota bacterium]